MLSPAVRPSLSRVFLTRADEPLTLTLYNGGSDTLVLSGDRVDDARVGVQVSGTTAEPGEPLLVKLVASADGADLDTTPVPGDQRPGLDLRG